MAWRIDFTRNADKAMRKLDKGVAARVFDELDEIVGAGPDFDTERRDLATPSTVVPDSRTSTLYVVLYAAVDGTVNVRPCWDDDCAPRLNDRIVGDTLSPRLYTASVER